MLCKGLFTKLIVQSGTRLVRYVSLRMIDSDSRVGCKVFTGVLQNKNILFSSYCGLAGYLDAQVVRYGLKSANWALPETAVQLLDGV